MNEAYVESCSQDRAQYIANLIAIHDWIAWRDISGADSLLVAALGAEIKKQLHYMKESL